MQNARIKDKLTRICQTDFTILPLGIYHNSMVMRRGTSILSNYSGNKPRVGFCPDREDPRMIPRPTGLAQAHSWDLVHGGASWHGSLCLHMKREYASLRLSQASSWSVRTLS